MSCRYSCWFWGSPCASPLPATQSYFLQLSLFPKKKSEPSWSEVATLSTPPLCTPTSGGRRRREKGARPLPRHALQLLGPLALPACLQAGPSPGHRSQVSNPGLSDSKNPQQVLQGLSWPLCSVHSPSPSTFLCRPPLTSCSQPCSALPGAPHPSLQTAPLSSQQPGLGIWTPP